MNCHWYTTEWPPISIITFVQALITFCRSFSFLGPFNLSSHCKFTPLATVIRTPLNQQTVKSISTGTLSPPVRIVGSHNSIFPTHFNGGSHLSRKCWHCFGLSWRLRTYHIVREALLQVIFHFCVMSDCRSNWLLPQSDTDNEFYRLVSWNTWKCGKRCPVRHREESDPAPHVLQEECPVTGHRCPACFHGTNTPERGHEV